MIYNILVIGNNIIARINKLSKVHNYLNKFMDRQAAIVFIQDENNSWVYEVSRPMTENERINLDGYITDTWFEIDLDRLTD